MKVSEAVQLWLEYHKSNSKDNTLRAYEAIFSKFCQEFRGKNLDELASDEVLCFLNQVSEGRKPQTRRTRYSHLSAFFNFLRNNGNHSFENPCDTPMMKKLFKARALAHRDIIEKEAIDEIIFRTSKRRNRLILELMARGGMRIGEVLKLTPGDVNERKLILRDPKSGKDREFVFLPQKVAERLKDYIRKKAFIPISASFRHVMKLPELWQKKAGDVVGISLRPHDLRRHAATYASRSGVPIEIVSKVILRHANLSTTQRYLGKFSDTEAMRWIENLYA